MATKFGCDGTDCPCHSQEKSRPPAAPITTGPVKITLGPGEAKYICTCGESKNYPFCDGSHKSSEVAKAAGIVPRPLKNEGTEPQDFYVCTCGHTKKENRTCDGSHGKVKPIA